MSVFRRYEQGFALPVVLISSIAMMVLLVTSLSASSSIVSALKRQHYDKLAQEAAESGSLMAEKCLRSATGFNVTAQIRPESTDCTGGTSVNCAAFPASDACYVLKDSKVRVKFLVTFGASTATERPYTVTTTVERRGVGSTASRGTDIGSAKRVLRFEYDPKASKLAQRYWYFGYGAGLDFGILDAANNPKPTPSICLFYSCVAYEGATSVSDRNGNFLFWTNGIDVWNRRGATMLYSGSGYERLKGADSATQANVVLPVANNPNRYVVVSNNTVTGLGTGDNDRGELYYSGVGMDASLDNGDGALLFNPPTRNTPVYAPATGYANESLSAAPKPDGSGYYVLTVRPSDLAILTFEFDSNGNRVGDYTAHDSLGTGSTVIKRAVPAISGFGTINFNKDFTKLVVINSSHCTAGKWTTASCQNRNGLMRVYDFNAKTGAVTNRVMWDAMNDVAATGYSADFSPNGKYIYASTLYPGRLYRYDISNPTGTQAFIADTAVDTKAYSAAGGGQVKRAPNDKMYVADDTRGPTSGKPTFSRISVIDRPDAATATASAVGWRYGGQTLTGVLPGTSVTVHPQSRYGLPQTLTVYQPKLVSY